MSPAGTAPVTLHDMERISLRATLSEPTLATASRGWAKTRDAILKGAEGAGAGRLEHAQIVRTKYVAIRRLSDEARRITLLESEPQKMRTVYAIDPHLITGYCQYWREKFPNFDFTQSEWDDDQDKERTEFIVFLLGAILDMRELICLDAGRQEIANILAYFLDEKLPRADIERHLNTFDSALEAILDETGVIDRSPHSRKRASEAIWARFEALIGAGGMPYLRQSMAVARLSNVLRSGKLKSSFAALRSKMQVDGDAELAAITRAETLFNAFSRNDELFRDARSSLYHAYVAFADATNLGVGREPSDQLSTLRGGETSNINALFEMHLLNICLSEAGAQARVHYITDSPLLYEFVYGFPRNSFSVELVHPRHVFVFENKPTPENFARYQQVLVGPNAFVHAVALDDSVRLNELKRFEDEFRSVLRDVRNSYSFASIDSVQGRRHLAEVITDFVSRFGSEGMRRKLDMVTDILESLSDKLEMRTGEVEQLFGSNADERSSVGFDAYRAFIENLPLKDRANTVLVRVFGDDEHGSPRIVCIPVSGGYRNLFKIYDPDVVRAVRREAGEQVMRKPINELLGMLDAGAQGKQDRTYRSALRDFGRAVYAMADREWLLAISFTQSVLRHLGHEPGLEDARPTARVTARTAEAHRRFLLQEALMVQHFARRGVAANLETLTRRQNRLLMAADDLCQSAALTQSVDDAESFDTAFEPNSVRQALSAIALTIEWLVVREMRRATGRRIPPCAQPGRMLPAARDAMVAWQGLAIAERTLENYWGGLDAATSLAGDLELLTTRIAAIVEEIERGEHAGHSADFWRYIQIRAVSLRALLALLVALEILPGETSLPSERERMQLRMLVRNHSVFVRGKGRPANEAEARLHPFANFLLDSLSFIEGEAYETEDMTSHIRRSQALLAIIDDHYRLSENGFPRLVSQTFLTRYGPDAAERLKRLAETLKRESLFGNTPFRRKRRNGGANGEAPSGPAQGGDTPGASD